MTSRYRLPYHCLARNGNVTLRRVSADFWELDLRHVDGRVETYGYDRAGDAWEAFHAVSHGIDPQTLRFPHVSMR